MIARKIDWIAFSFSDPESYKILEDLVRGYVEQHSKSRFYVRVLRGPGFSLSSIPRNKNLTDYQAEFSGVGCSLFGGIDIYRTFKERVKIYRLDLAWDLISTWGAVEPIFWPEDFKPTRGQPLTQFWVDGEYTGVVMGRTDFRLRYYNKEVESGSLLEDGFEWWRMEIAVRGDLCKAQAWGEDPWGVGLGLLSRRVNFPGIDRLGLVADANPAPRAPGDDPSDSLYLYRLKQRVKKGLIKLKRLGGEIDFVEGEL